MAPTTYKIKEIKLRDLDSPRHRKWDLLDREDKMFLFRKENDPILKNCREHYLNGLGTRKFEKLCEMNFGMEDYETVLGYTTDRNNKVIRVFANKYMDNLPEGDTVSESVHWPPQIGKPSKGVIFKNEFYYN